MRKPLRGLIIAGIIGIVLLGLGYVGLAMYYAEGFSVNTWINGVYCTGSSVQEINAQLLEETSVPATITIIGYDETGMDCEPVSWTISSEELRLSVDYLPNLNNFLSNENSMLWIKNLFVGKSYTVEPNVGYSEIVLQQKMDEIVRQSSLGEEYYIEYMSSMGYILYDGVHNKIDADKAYEAVVNAVLTQAESVNLIESGCYYDVPLTPEQEEDMKLWEKIKAFQENGPVYDFGNGAVRVDSTLMAEIIQKDEMTRVPFTDEEGRLVLVDNSAESLVKRIASKTDTYGKTWEFKSTRGEIVSVEGKTYGTLINQERETVWMEEYLQKLLEGKIAAGSFEAGSENNPRIPEYTREAYNRSSDLGDTYIEVDMGMQKLYYYKDGNLMVETDVVTGNMRRGWDTPEGVNYVYNKQKNRILRGEGYATPVDFWMPVNGAIGIHDADWRKEFGGEEYLTNGSHGCVNVPKEVMPELYELIEIGTPVVMFYGSVVEETENSKKDT